MKTKILIQILFSLLLVISSSSFAKSRSVVKTDTLHVMISKANHIYYYQNKLMEDASNFMTQSSRGIRIIIDDLIRSSKSSGHHLIILLKVANEKLLDESSKRVVEYIKTKSYQLRKLSSVEKWLIKKTEENS